LSWQNSRELQLGPNRTFKSKLWTFENTVQTVETCINEQLIEPINEEISAKAETRKPFKLTSSNFDQFQKEFFQEYVDYKLPHGSKRMRDYENENDDEKSCQAEEDVEENDSEFEDDDKIEDGPISYDENPEESEILSNIVNNPNAKNENKIHLQQPVYNVSDMPPTVYEPLHYENDVNCNKKLRNNNENTYNLAYNQSIQYMPSQDQNCYLNTNSLQCFDTNRSNIKYLNCYDNQDFFMSNQENYENHLPKTYQTYDLNNNTISCNYSASNLNNRSPYYLNSLQNSSYVFENQSSNIKYSNEPNEYSNLFDLNGTQSSLSDPFRFNSKLTGQSFSQFSNNFSNAIDFNSSMSSSTSSLCSYNNINTLHENSTVNIQLNLNDFSMSQNY